MIERTPNWPKKTGERTAHLNLDALSISLNLPRTLW